MGATLIFPSSMREALPFLAQARQYGGRIIGASSVANDPNAREFDHWLYLPNVWDENFCWLLNRVITELGIERIFCPNNVAHKVIDSLIGQKKIATILLPLPFHAELYRWQQLEERSNTVLRIAHQVGDDAARISRQQVVAWLNYIDRIAGQSGEAKLAALLGALSCAPKGDVVEIGTYFGKSAAWLLLVARTLEIGKVLAIDPWLAAASVQEDAPRVVQDLAQGDYWEAVANACVASLLPIAFDDFNVLRERSADAFPVYQSRTVYSLPFGSTKFAGKIALLHIDGNHDYAVVSEDVRLWAGNLAAGGWLVLDDYCWPHGDGPRRVGNQLLERCGARVVTSFVIDGALFVQMS